MGLVTHGFCLATTSTSSDNLKGPNVTLCWVFPWHPCHEGAHQHACIRDGHSDPGILLSWRLAKGGPTLSSYPTSAGKALQLCQWIPDENEPGSQMFTDFFNNLAPSCSSYSMLFPKTAQEKVLYIRLLGLPGLCSTLIIAQTNLYLYLC